MSDTINHIEYNGTHVTYTGTLEEDPFIASVKEQLDEIQDLLIKKNTAYGDAALSPMRVFSKSDSIEQIKVRIDDKLSRIKKTGITDSSEDTVLDLIGYLILLRIKIKEEGV